MKRLLIVAALLAALGTSAAALAAGGPTITEKILGAASISHPYTFDVHKPATSSSPRRRSRRRELRLALAPSRRGGRRQVRHADALRQRRSQLHPAAQLRRPGIHRAAAARPSGPQRRPHQAVVLVTYLGLKHGLNPDVPAAAPGNCPF